MINFIVKIILSIFDYFHKKKIINKLKTTQKSGKFEMVFDVGGHKGESVELFENHLNVKNIYSFEPSEKSFKILSNKSHLIKNKNRDINIFLENSAVGSSNQSLELNYLNETSSSTLRNLNIESQYFKKKEKYFGKLINKKIQVKQINFKEYLIKNKINKIDLLKIDTEGYEFEVLKGLGDLISRVSVILFEHHYDNMIIKKYTFNDIHNLLKSNGFQRIFKIKMPFRKSFDYIYMRNPVIK